MSRSLAMAWPPPCRRNRRMRRSARSPVCISSQQFLLQYLRIYYVEPRRTRIPYVCSTSEYPFRTRRKNKNEEDRFRGKSGATVSEPVCPTFTAADCRRIKDIGP